MLHDPEEEERTFKDSGRLTLKDILEPNPKKLGAMAVSTSNPLEIASEHHYGTVFEVTQVQKYLAAKWVGGRELNQKLDRLVDELMERCAMPPKKWSFTYPVVRFLIWCTQLLVCIDDGPAARRVAAAKWCPPVLARMLNNQGTRSRQMFTVPQVR
jgi:hypothetical protein